MKVFGPLMIYSQFADTSIDNQKSVNRVLLELIPHVSCDESFFKQVY